MNDLSEEELKKRLKECKECLNNIKNDESYLKKREERLNKLLFDLRQQKRDDQANSLSHYIDAVIATRGDMLKMRKIFSSEIAKIQNILSKNNKK